MKNWIVPAAIAGIAAWVWFKNKKTQAVPIPGGGSTSGSGQLPPTGMTLVKNKYTGQQTWIFNKDVSAYLAGDWVLA